MPVPQSTPTRGKRKRAYTKPQRATHLHLPSVHVHAPNGDGYDYSEDLVVRGRRIERTVTFDFTLQGGAFHRVTRDELCEEEQHTLVAMLPKLLAEDQAEDGGEAAELYMGLRAASEYQRQLRIVHGLEHACAGCGCSESRACSGGCIWITPATCSRCFLRSLAGMPS